jgi:ubiquinone/menaquinone biosynthesis C-methylase UbiE
LSAVDAVDLDDPKTQVLADLIRGHCTTVPDTILVVGCGNGIEAAVLGGSLGARVTGIDLETDFDERALRLADLKYGDATNLEFADESYDFVLSFHALEHIPDFRKALSEMRRVLRPSAGWLIGTPNRDRLVGYLGSRDATLRQKLEWNFADWSAKFRGRFRNEMGAHAGFTTAELAGELTSVFGSVKNITGTYYRALYPRRKRLVGVVLDSGMARWLFPAVYFMGSK